MAEAGNLSLLPAARRDHVEAAAVALGAEYQ